MIPRKPVASTIILAFAVLIGFSADASAAAPLGAYRVPAGKIAVAGISSGGAMAVQMSVAYSHLFKGTAIYAGIPYYCAQGSEVTALTTCAEDVPAINLANLESITRQYAAQGLIDPTRDLEAQHVYLLVRHPRRDGAAAGDGRAAAIL
jgi:dienelactone hydrolase